MTRRHCERFFWRSGELNIIKEAKMKKHDQGGIGGGPGICGTPAIEAAMEARAVTVLRRVWSYVGADCLHEIQEGAGRDYATQEEVIQALIDHAYGSATGDEEAAQWFRSLTYDEMVEIGKQAFPMKRYGW